MDGYIYAFYLQEGPGKVTFDYLCSLAASNPGLLRIEA